MIAGLIDSHTHLAAKDFDADREEVIQRARDVGIELLICIGAGYGAESARAAVQLAEKHSFVFASIGIHPNDAAHPFDAALLGELARHPKVVAIGETGLDYHWNYASKEQQEIWFRHQIELALEVKKPVVIHSREAGEDCFRILSEYPVASVGGVFHCFAEDAAFAARLRQLSFLISIPGTVTFKNAELLRSVAREVPLDQIMLETDAPFLAPIPYRGKRNEPAYMIETVKKIAECRGMSVDDIAKATSENARRLFRLPAA